MRLKTKIIIICLAALSLLYSVTYIFIIFKGRPIMLRELAKATGRKVTIGYFDLVPPLNIEIKNLDIEGLAKVEKVLASLSLTHLITGRFALNNVKIIAPVITFERKVSETKDVDTSAKPVPVAAQKTKEKGRLTFKRLTIKNGKINFIDYTAGAEPLKVIIKDLNFDLHNIFVFPVSAITNFNLTGKIPWKEGEKEGSIEAGGWINFFKKDMLASIKIADINGIYLYPYYANWVDLGKARIEKAKLQLTSNIHGIDNNVTADCHLELTDIVRKPRLSDEPQEKAERITDTVLDMFKAQDDGKMILDFSIKTKFDKPEFSFSDIKTAFEGKLSKAYGDKTISPEGILLFPLKVLEGTIKGATDVSKAVIEGTFAVGNELKKSVEGTFKREPQEQKKQEEK